MSEFLYMGSYGLYVWTSYGLALLILVINIWGPSRKHQKNVQSAQDFQHLNENGSDDT
mgnify:CR=1 FL=1